MFASPGQPMGSGAADRFARHVVPPVTRTMVAEPAGCTSNVHTACRRDERQARIC
jgi:hypothetical protein